MKNVLCLHILATRSWLPDPGCQKLANRSWLQDPDNNVLFTILINSPVWGLALGSYIYIYICVFLKQSLPLLIPGKNDSRRRFINIDAIDPTYYCSGGVGRSRALLPQQHFRARCLQNGCENHYFSSQIIIFKLNSILFHNFRYQILASRSWLSNPGFQILAATS